MHGRRVHQQQEDADRFARAGAALDRRRIAAGTLCVDHVTVLAELLALDDIVVRPFPVRHAAVTAGTSPVVRSASPADHCLLFWSRFLRYTTDRENLAALLLDREWGRMHASAGARMVRSGLLGVSRCVELRAHPNSLCSQDYVKIAF